MLQKTGGKNATFFIRSDPRSLNREINVYIYSYVSSAGVTVECVTRAAVKNNQNATHTGNEYKNIHVKFVSQQQNLSQN